MTTLARSRYHLCIGVAAALLAACSGSQPPISASGESAMAARSGAERPLVYVSQQADNSVSIFRLGGKRIGRLTKSINYPQGLYADANGTLYVANRGDNNVLEFKRGEKSPFKVLTDGKNQPEGVTTCPDGTVYVANILGASGGGGGIAVYAHGSKHPTGSLDYTGDYFFFLACDAQGNLFGSEVYGSTGTVVEFPSAQQSGAKQLPINWGGNPAGIIIDPQGNLLVADQGAGVEEFTESGYPTGLQFSTVGVNQIALGPHGKQLLGSTSSGAVQYRYHGGVLDHMYRAGGTPIGVAVDPDAN